jgi:biotin synthase-related radical SAM superfamily protein
MMALTDEEWARIVVDRQRTPEQAGALRNAAQAIAEENVSLRVQVTRLSGPVSDKEWAEFQQISRSEGGVMQRFRINDLLAARKNARRSHEQMD